MKRNLAVAALLALAPAIAHGQIRVDPNGVNVNTHGATTVFLTFGGIGDYVPVEAMWCGRLIAAAPASGRRCDPSAIFGQLPIRYDQSRLQAGTFTDIMSIPASVSRRAYEAAVEGETSSFFYVRRFVSRTGAGPDQFVAVTCRLAGGGARVPFGLTHVDVRFAVEAPVVFARPHEVLPSLQAEIAYSGTGRLRGRWEVVLPGEELPSARDLLTEASLPANERGLQRRYMELERFDVFLPPTGRVTLPGPNPERLPNTIDGTYFILLRIEATDDKEGDSRLASVGAGQGVIHSGAVAGFPMPALRYFIGANETRLSATSPERDVRLLLPLNAATLAPDSALPFSWVGDPVASYYRFELARTSGDVVFSAIVDGALPAYQLPPFANANIPDGQARWRVIGLDAGGREVRRSVWRDVQLTAKP